MMKKSKDYLVIIGWLAVIVMAAAMTLKILNVI